MTRVLVAEERCKGCEICVASCPREALRMCARVNSKGYFVAELVSDSDCNSCGLCAMMCPDVALWIYRPPR